MLPEEDILREKGFVNELSWTVIPALPGTRISWEAGWCPEGWVEVHAWLMDIDIVGLRSEPPLDTSCVLGEPMILNASGRLQVARYADLEGTAGEVYVA
jgi:hypothetical protein